MGNYLPPAKRSLTLCGHRTSVTLEEPFWRSFQDIARNEGISVNALAARIDAIRPSGVGLASAIRVYVLDAALRNQSIHAAE
ncbi:MAG: ribbon-helix-helix domain-containing protein [Paracoccaceae bacterium]